MANSDIKAAAREVLRMIQDGKVRIVHASGWMIAWDGVVEIAPITDKTMDELLAGGYIDRDTHRITERGKEALKS